MQPIPMDWIDKLFNCMKQFYGDRWTKPIEKPHMESFYKTIWQGGLSGLNYEQIKWQLVRCKRHAEDPSAIPLQVVDFYRFAKEKIEPIGGLHTDVNKMRNNEIAKQHMADIKQKLNMTI